MSFYDQYMKAFTQPAQSAQVSPPSVNPTISDFVTSVFEGKRSGQYVDPSALARQRTSEEQKIEANAFERLLREQQLQMNALDMAIKAAQLGNADAVNLVETFKEFGLEGADLGKAIMAANDAFEDGGARKADVAKFAAQYVSKNPPKEKGAERPADIRKLDIALELGAITPEDYQKGLKQIAQYAGTANVAPGLLTGSQSGKMRQDLQDRAATAQKVISRVQNLRQKILEGGDKAFGKAGELTSDLKKITTEISGLSKSFGLSPEEEIGSDYRKQGQALLKEINPTAFASDEIASAYSELGYLYAKLLTPGDRITDADYRNAIITLGSDASTPESAASILANRTTQLVEDINNQIRAAPALLGNDIGVSEIPLPQFGEPAPEDYPIAKNPQTGETIIYKDGKWQPLQ